MSTGKELLFTFHFRGAEWAVSLVPEHSLVDAHAECHFNTQEILVEKCDWTKMTPRRIREIFWHELTHTMNQIIFGALPDDESLTVTAFQLDELLAENTSSALLELIPQLPSWLLDNNKVIPFTSPKKRSSKLNGKQKS